VKDNVILRVKKFTKQERVTEGKVKKKMCLEEQQKDVQQDDI